MLEGCSEINVLAVFVDLKNCTWTTDFLNYKSKNSHILGDILKMLNTLVFTF